MFECDADGRKVMRRPWGLLAGAVVLMAGGVFSFWYFQIVPIQTHRTWDDRVRADYRALERMRPAEVSPDQWLHLVSWTVNLHANCSWHSSVDPDWREDFAAALEERMRGSFGPADIDWIWDEYAKHTKDGAEYSRRFRAEMWDTFHLIRQ